MDIYKESIEKLETEAGFFRHNNFHVIEASEENIIIKAELNKNAMNPYGVVHGGLIFGLGDTVMGMLAKATGRNAITLSANISYIKPGNGKYLTAQGEIIKKGRNIIFLRANIYNDKENLIATMDSNYIYID